MWIISKILIPPQVVGRQAGHVLLIWHDYDSAFIPFLSFHSFMIPQYINCKAANQSMVSRLFLILQGMPHLFLHCSCFPYHKKEPRQIKWQGQFLNGFHHRTVTVMCTCTFGQNVRIVFPYTIHGSSYLCYFFLFCRQEMIYS